ncbi:MAG TPA: cyclase family protein [Amycolatopsis sp.]|nr:cyclase family protein [Amycolatopsis sp.]
MADEKLPAYAELPVTPGAPPHSSWGLWGADDQLGCLNLLSAQRVLDTVSDLRRGRVIALNASLELFTEPLFGRPKLEHEISLLDRGLVRDETLSSFNTQCSSQWDGLKHARSREYGFYNGLPEDALTVSSWAEKGIAGRGLLLDLERYRETRGRPLRFDEPDPISVADLCAAAEDQDVGIQVGDLLVIHTGWLDWARRTSPGGLPGHFAVPGLRPGRDMLAFLWDRHVAAVASDTPTVEVWPPGALATAEQRRAARSDPAALAEVVMHADLLALLGMPLGELWDTGALARACRALGKWDFLLTSAPLNLPGGVASPSNALAIV